MKTLFLCVSIFAMSIASFGQQRVSQPRSRADILNEEYSTGLFKTTDATFFDFTDESVSTTAMGYRNVLDWLQGRVAGLQIYKTIDNISIAFIRNQRAAVFIDEIPVYLNEAGFFSIPDIALIKIIKNPVVSGWRGPGGAIVIYTKRGEAEEE